ncbi:uncharacterized protein KQ657_000223 [Scheffersomyces spartinae]|uniref:Uncharacterized protein n=1 Tax=Scheffersomyces spartinae TaxID=45513 RepID=A0A9P7VDL3_9ASCO|nr:uncharacterized protein KQ657_000223 [Scheffersomyces spartinae]KAG7196210.1 hypothetical protein KQ657_000223 [Scheffersomyces spartinae]
MFSERVANGKYLRDLPYSKRFLLYHGEDSEYFQYTLKYREAWHDKLFYVSEDSCDDFKSDWSSVTDLNLQDIVIGKPSKDLAVPITTSTLQITKDNGKPELVDVSTDIPMYLKEQTQRNCLMINCGGPITSMKWLINSNPLTSVQYLAVSVILSDVDDAINLPMLSLFHKGNCNELPSAIKIFEYDTSTNTILLKKTLLTTNLGPSHDLHWVPIHNEKSIGVLVGSFSDGKLHLIKITDAILNGQEPVMEIIQPSFSYELKTRITCFSFLGVDKALVGLSDGSIAEFIFPWSHHVTDLSIPSFIHRVAETSITTVAVAEQDENNYVIVNSTGTFSFAFEYSSFILDRVDMTTNMSMVAYTYNKALRVCVGVFGDFVGSFFPRVPLESPNQLLRMSGQITALGASKWLSHPLLLAGNSLGEVFILNFARKLLNGNKTTNKSSLPLRLWKVDFDNELKQQIFNHSYLPVLPDEASLTSLAPTEITISSLEWNENVIGSSIYSMGTLGGMLLVERLDPAN